MIKLLIEAGILILDGNQDSEIFNWEHQLFLSTVLGYSLIHSRSRYEFEDQTQLLEILLETVSYLEDLGLKFEVDDRVGQILEENRAETEDFQYASELGEEAKRVIQEDILPEKLIRQLRSFQVQAVNHLLTVKHGANFSVPGSGKTTAIYTVFEILRGSSIVEKMLVVGPRSCFFPWEDEYKECFGLPITSGRLTGPKMSRESIYLASDQYTLFLCTYQTASNDLEELINLCKKHKIFVVIDESHNIKKIDGGVWSDAMIRLAPYAIRRAVLSGTPMPNRYSDVWTQITFLWPGKQLLGDRYSYKIRSENVHDHLKIRNQIRPFFFRVTKSDLNLPPVNFHRIECDLKPYQNSIYQALSTKFIAEIDALPEDRHRLREWRKARVVRLLQAASNPVLLSRYSDEFDIPPLEAGGASVIQIIDEYPRYEIPAKIEAATELIKKLMVEGNKVVLWTSFVHNIKMLTNLLQDLDHFLLYGAVPRDESEDIEFNREQQIKHFKEIKTPAVLIANPAACAESISLHKSCHHAVYLERTFNCGQYMQSLDRIHRIGLGPTDEATYYILIATNTIDETIDRRLSEKQIAMEQLLDGDVNVGSFEVDFHQTGRSESEEAVDYEEAIKDIQSQLKESSVDD